VSSKKEPRPTKDQPERGNRIKNNTNARCGKENKPTIESTNNLQQNAVALPSETEPTKNLTGAVRALVSTLKRNSSFGKSTHSKMTGWSGNIAQKKNFQLKKE